MLLRYLFKTTNVKQISGSPKYLVLQPVGIYKRQGEVNIKYELSRYIKSLAVEFLKTRSHHLLSVQREPNTHKLYCLFYNFSNQKDKWDN